MRNIVIIRQVSQQCCMSGHFNEQINVGLFIVTIYENEFVFEKFTVILSGCDFCIVCVCEDLD